MTLARKYRWTLQARANQLAPPGDWRTWLILAGRGFGKTRTGAEATRQQIEQGKVGRIALIAETAADARDVMVEGSAGILAVSPPWNKPKYEPSKRRLTWDNGAIATTYSAEDPDQLRGPEHDWWWGDEIAKWKHAQEAFDNLMFGLRVGANPRGVGTTTPRPISVIRELLKDPTVHVTKGTTYDNLDNLPPAFFDKIIRKYEGTRLGRQELDAELLEDVPGALWTYGLIEQGRVDVAPELQRIVIAIDPAVTSHDDSDETGIIAAGLGIDGHGYILDDKSLRGSPDAWASVAIALYHALGADRVVAEVNNGGDMVESTLRIVDSNVSYTKLHASRGKIARAEPVSALYEQGRVHHVGPFPHLEDQMCLYVPGEAKKSPDRMDALVWALTELIVDSGGIGVY